MLRAIIAADTIATAIAVLVPVQSVTARKCDGISNTDAGIINYRIMNQYQ
jgi:hypothetical protein